MSRVEVNRLPELEKGDMEPRFRPRWEVTRYPNWLGRLVGFQVTRSYVYRCSRNDLRFEQSTRPVPSWIQRAIDYQPVYQLPEARVV